jgi:catechol-2,3-dioxygenase
MNHPKRNLPIPDKALRPVRLAHIVFRTKQLQAMIDWYCLVLGAHVVFKNSKIAFLTYDDEHHRIALIGYDDLEKKAPSPSVGFYHVAFTYEGLAQLLQNYVRLKELGVTPYRPIVHGPTVSMYYRDPDGNEIELQVDAFPSADEATAYMNGPAFSSDPIGILFDPEDMIKRYESGESITSLTRRADS